MICKKINLKAFLNKDQNKYIFLKNDYTKRTTHLPIYEATEPSAQNNF